MEYAQLDILKTKLHIFVTIVQALVQIVALLLLIVLLVLLIIIFLIMYVIQFVLMAILLMVPNVQNVFLNVNFAVMHMIIVPYAHQQLTY